MKPRVFFWGKIFICVQFGGFWKIYIIFHHHKILAISISPKVLSCPFVFNYLSLLPGPENCWFGFCFFRFAFSIMCYKWIRTVCSLSDLASLIQNNTSEIHLCFYMYQDFIFFYCWVVFHCVDKPQFVYLLTNWWTFGLFLVSGYYQWSSYKHSCTAFLWKWWPPGRSRFAKFGLNIKIDNATQTPRKDFLLTKWGFLGRPGWLPSRPQNGLKDQGKEAAWGFYGDWRLG